MPLCDHLIHQCEWLELLPRNYQTRALMCWSVAGIRRNVLTYNNSSYDFERVLNPSNARRYYRQATISAVKCKRPIRFWFRDTFQSAFQTKLCRELPCRRKYARYQVGACGRTAVSTRDVYLTGIYNTYDGIWQVDMAMYV